jgi:hypothetical protein
MQRLTHERQGMTPYCTIQDVPLYNMRCDQFLAVWGMDAHRLDDLNPGVGKNCENWKYGKPLQSHPTSFSIYTNSALT